MQPLHKAPDSTVSQKEAKTFSVGDDVLVLCYGKRYIVANRDFEICVGADTLQDALADYSEAKAKKGMLP